MGILKTLTTSKQKDEKKLSYLVDPHSETYSHEHA